MTEETCRSKPQSITAQAMIFVLLVIVNMILIGMISYLTTDVEANLNSQFGAFLLSFFIPLFIISATPKIKPVERSVMFGSGIVAYSILIFFIHGIAVSFISGLIPSTIIFLITLIFGDRIKPFL